MFNSQWTKNKIERILEQHKLWLQSKGEFGKCAKFYRANLVGADFSNVDLYGQVLMPKRFHARYYEAIGRSTITKKKDKEFVSDVFIGPSKYEQSRIERERENKDWAIYMELIYTCGADFVLANCEGVNFSNADLRGAQFHGANLTDAKFTGADLRDVCFGKTERSILNLYTRPLRLTNLSGADLSAAKNLVQSQLDGATFGDVRTKMPPGLRIEIDPAKVIEIDKQMQSKARV